MNNQENQKSRAPRVLGAIILFLIILFFAIDLIIRESQQFSPTSLTNILLSTLQIIVLLLFLILFFIFCRNLIKLYLERKHKVAGAHFKTKLLLFFTALSLIPTLLLFFFASDLISRNIETWFKTPIDKILNDTKNLSEGFYQNAREITFHHAQQLSNFIQEQQLIKQGRLPLMNFVREKLTEYHLDEISIYLDGEDLFSYLNPNLPLQYYRELKSNTIKRAHLGERFSSIEPMGTGEMIRRGVAVDIPNVGNFLVVTGKFLPQNYTQRINNISAYVQRYQQLKIQKNPLKTFYLITLTFITLLIIFAASWIGFHLAKGITVPIEKLALATKEISKGNLNVRVKAPASDELGILIDSFNQMTADLNSSQQAIAQKTSELSARKQHIETILTNITTGVITLNAEGVITTINPSAKEMLALTEKNPVGKHYQNILNHSRYKDVVDTIKRGLNKRIKTSNREIKINTGNQNITLALTLTPLNQTDSRFSGMIVVLDDFTQLINAQKIAAWKEVAQRVAHEIKNPLTPIQLSAERIIKNIQNNQSLSNDIIKEGASTIVQEAGTIKSLVDEFSSFARMPNIRLQPSDMNEIISQTVSLFKGIYTDIAFDISFSHDLPSPIHVDPEQMKRVFINLIDNAIDAMNKKGNIKITTSFEKNDQHIHIDITDSGPGISDEDKDKLFIPYFSTKKKGNGLGLAIVNQIIIEHNGTIKFENNKPSGAKFCIRIPI
ncbi:MAG: HAMP domain-containing protein [Candidatus Aminicenantes bacterium]|nr:HAMP domain-containing protein [Candidatus Aminicenantes bacterium]